MKILTIFLLIFAFCAWFALAQDSGVGSITQALQQGESDIRSGIMPAVVGILTAILLISVAASVVWVIVKN